MHGVRALLRPLAAEYSGTAPPEPSGPTPETRVGDPRIAPDDTLVGDPRAGAWALVKNQARDSWSPRAGDDEEQEAQADSTVQANPGAITPTSCLVLLGVGFLGRR